MDSIGAEFARFKELLGLVDGHDGGLGPSRGCRAFERLTIKELGL